MTAQASTSSSVKWAHRAAPRTHQHGACSHSACITDRKRGRSHGHSQQKAAVSRWTTGSFSNDSPGHVKPVHPAAACLPFTPEKVTTWANTDDRGRQTGENNSRSQESSGAEHGLHAPLLALQPQAVLGRSLPLPVPRRLPWETGVMAAPTSAAGKGREVPDTWSSQYIFAGSPLQRGSVPEF